MTATPPDPSAPGGHALRSAQTRATFDQVAAGYDRPALGFFQRGAEALVERLALAGTERLLDVATGTGAVALAAARRLPRGTVVGEDISPGMLAVGAAKARTAGLHQVAFRPGDFSRPPHGEPPFDAVTCGFGLFFLDDLAGGLACMAQRVKPGGRVAFSSFASPLFPPLVQHFWQRAPAFGLQPEPAPWRRMDHPQHHRELALAAGLTRVESHPVALGAFLPGPHQWWDVLWFTGFRRVLETLPAPQLARLRREHLADVAPLATPQGLWLEVNGIITVAHTAP